MKQAIAAGLLGSLIAVAAFEVTAQINPFHRSDFQLQPEDVALLQEAAKSLYENDDVDVGKVQQWSNPNTGNHGTVQLVGKFTNNGMPCRRLQHDIKVAEDADPYRFIVDRCRTPSGEWKIL